MANTEKLSDPKERVPERVSERLPRPDLPVNAPENQR
jgi:hypothetical protein